MKKKIKLTTKADRSWPFLTFPALSFYFLTFAWEVWHTYSMLRLYGPSAEKTINRLFFEKFGVIWLIVPVTYYILRGVGAAWLIKITYRTAATRRAIAERAVSYITLFALFLAGVAHTVFSVPYGNPIFFELPKTLQLALQFLS